MLASLKNLGVGYGSIHLPHEGESYWAVNMDEIVSYDEGVLVGNKTETSAFIRLLNNHPGLHVWMQTVDYRWSEANYDSSEGTMYILAHNGICTATVTIYFEEGRSPNSESGIVFNMSGQYVDVLTDMATQLSNMAADICGFDVEWDSLKGKYYAADVDRFEMDMLEEVAEKLVEELECDYAPQFTPEQLDEMDRLRDEAWEREFETYGVDGQPGQG